MRKCASLLLLLLLTGCRFELTTPSPAININNNNTNNNSNNVTPVTPIVVIPPSGGTTTTVPPTNTTPPGTPLPLPPNTQAIITSLGQQYAALVGSCDYLFIDALLATLRPQDTHWGYVCKRGNCSDISQDVIAYHAGGGADVRGATGTYEIDVIGSSCSAAATPQYLNFGYAATNVFSPSRQ